MYRLFSFVTLFILSTVHLSAAIVLTEDFNNFTEGSETTPSPTISDFDAITHTPGWSGSNVCQAGGCAYIPTGAQLATPPLDLGANGGNYCISFKARSATKDAFFFLMDSNSGYMSGNITDEWTTYTVSLPTGSGPSIKSEPTIIYFYGYTDFFIDDLIIDDSGVAVPKALPATEFQPDSFTANWETSLNAKTYLLNVFTLDYDVATTIFSRKYLVKDKEVVGTSFSVERPDFDTPYYYTVAAKSGEAVSGESNVITVYPDNVDPVEALAPSDVTDKSFTANWTTSELATQYYLHILKYHQTLQDESYAIIDTDFSDIKSAGTIDTPQKELEWLFDGDWFANMPVLAEGIIGINNQDINFFGQAYLQSPIFDMSASGGEIKISFTAFSRKGLKNACVKLCNHLPSISFTDVKDFTVSETPETFSFTLSGGTAASSLIITSEDSGMMFIDDLKVTLELPANSSIILPVKTMNTPETSEKINCSAMQKNDRLAYYVRASWAVSHKDGEVRQIPEVISSPSNYVWVQESAAINNVSTDRVHCVASAIDGIITIDNPDRLPLSVYTPSGTCVCNLPHPDSIVKIQLKPGIYIVRIGAQSFKLSNTVYF